MEDKYKEIIDKVAEKMQNIEPIYKGCSHGGPCFCTGKCQEVIGERDKITGKVTYYEKKTLW